MGTTPIETEPIPPAWPEDRYEVRCVLPPPIFIANDRYHYARHAQEAVRRRRETGLATDMKVVRLSDNTVLFDLAGGDEQVLDSW